MNFKKLLSLLLSVVMVVTLVPFGALAEETVTDNNAPHIYMYMGQNDSQDTKREVTSSIGTQVGSGYSFEFWMNDEIVTNVTAPTVEGVSIVAHSTIAGRFNISFTAQGTYDLEFDVNGTKAVISAEVAANGNTGSTPPSGDDTDNGTDDDTATTGYSLYESDSADSGYAQITDGVLDIALGQTMYVKMHDGTNYIADHTTVSVSGHNTNSVTVTAQEDYIVVTASETNTSRNAVTFSDSSNSVTVDISVYSTILQMVMTQAIHLQAFQSLWNMQHPQTVNGVSVWVCR